LSTWFRVYYFTPFSRLLIQSRFKMPQWMMIFLAQLSTMVLIGLWHGITLNFVVWGLWHGIGLFGFRIISDRTKGWHKQVSRRVWSKNLLYIMSVFITFHYVALGWLFF